MELIKKYVDTAIVLGGILGAMIWISGKFNDIDRRLIRIETVMIMKGIIPSELITKNEKQIIKDSKWL